MTIATKSGQQETYTAARQLSDKNTVGTIYGQTSVDKIGFYGVAAGVAQRSNGAQAAVSRASAGATMFAVNTVTMTPSAVAASTVAAQSITMTGSPLLTPDFVIVNKVTAQAGLGIADARVSSVAATLDVNFCNPTATAVTPTVAENYLVAGFRGLASSVTLSPAQVAANSTTEELFTVTGVVSGQLLAISKPTDQAGLGIVGCRVAANNQIGITFMNDTITALTPTASEAYSYIALDGLNVESNVVVLGANIGSSPSLPTAGQVTEQAITVTNGVLVDDTVVGFSKPTTQTPIAPVGCRVSAANVLGMTFWGATTPVTPTASEVYTVTLHRKKAVAPLTLYSVALTPAAVAPLTTAEQGFTVTGLVASQVVWVNKPTATASIGVAGCRVSAANVLGITYSNTSTATITPPSETYLVGHFQLFPSSGSYLAQEVSPAGEAATDLVNEIRSTLTGLNLFVGS